jgi:methanogenic corrinoid protein MtbC1
MTVYRYVRLGMLPARKLGGTWRIAPADLKRLRAVVARPGRKRSAPWRQRLEARMVAGDEAGSWKVAEAALLSGMEPADFYCDALIPALRSIGDRWQSGEVGVEEEHLASGVALRIIGRLGPRFARPGQTRGTVVTAMPSGERHLLGLAVLADILRFGGYRVLNLGADTPAPAVLSAVGRVDDLAAIAVAVVDTRHLGEASSLIRKIRTSAPGIPIVAGGRAIPDEKASRALGADGWTSDARQVGALISRLRPVPGEVASRSSGQQ